MSKRTPEETLAAIESQAADDDMDDVLAMTPEERRRELAAAGFDLAATAAKAEALHAAAQVPTSAVVVPLRPRRTLRVVMLLAAALTIAAVATILARRDPQVAHFHPDTPSPSDEPTPAQRNAAELRKQAAAACDAKKIAECVDRMNEARDLDPAGDTLPEAKAIRERIEALEREKVEQERGDKPGRP
jgi:hypothetical protein